MSIYQDVILEHYHNPHNFGHLKNPTATILVDNVSCGDKLTMEVVIKNGTVEQVAISGEGCAISMAAASMLSTYMKNKKADSLIKFDKEAMIRMLGIELSPNRLKCGLLAREAMIKVCKKQ